MRKKPLVALATVVVVAVLAIWGFTEGRKERAIEQERERPVNVASRVVPQADGTAVAFDAETQKRADIEVATVQHADRRGEVEALATVLPLQELIDLRNAYTTARSQVDRANAPLEASRREYERVKVLHDDDRNVSDKVLDAAQAAARSDEAALRAAKETLEAVERGARQKWGPALAAAVIGDTPLFRDLAELRLGLLRVAAPSGAGAVKPSATIRLDPGDGAIRAGKFISASPQADPRVQGPTFFYSAPPDGLLQGATVTAHLSTGAELSGGIVPREAVVWWQGKAWFYLQSAPDRFVRRELADAMPVEQGWFVAELSPVRIVVRGAQVLLSEELRSQIKVGEESK